MFTLIITYTNGKKESLQVELPEIVSTQVSYLKKSNVASVAVNWED